MKSVRAALILVLCATLVVYGQGNTFNKVRYNGGTVATKVGPKDWGNRLTVSSEAITFRLKDGQSVEINPRLVTGLSYGQEAHRRVGTMVALGILFAPLALFGLFHKTRLHFIGIEYRTPDGKPAGLLLQGHKNNYRAILMALRGATGAAVAVAEEDRKYVPTGVEVTVSQPTKEQQAGNQTTEATQSPQNQTGGVILDSDPSSAEVWIDGVYVGNTPAKLSLVAGKHTIRVSRDGYESWEREIQVLPDSEVTLKVTLRKSGPA